MLTGAFGLFVGLSALPSLDGSERLRGLGDSAKDQWHLMELVRGRKRKEEEEEKRSKKKKKGQVHSNRTTWSTLVELFTTKTFLLLFLRSALDGIPMNANSLLVLWFEYMGYAEVGAFLYFVCCCCC